MHEEFIFKALSLLLLLVASTLSFLLARKLRFPYTLFLVLVGSVLAFASHLPQMHFISAFKLTPEILFYVFLPTLLFEAAYNIKLKRLLENIRAISLLAVFGLLISAFGSAFILYLLLPLFGIEVPFLILLLFGAIISATDPVAVIALFKEYSAPKRLSLIFEGESLFNDGTAVALFAVVLGLLQSAGSVDTNTFVHGFASFMSMIFLGIALGFVSGTLFSKAMQWAKDENLQITLALLSAHSSFILAEFINEFTKLEISPIITTVIASLIIGNYGRYKLTPSVEKMMNKFWEYFAFLANSLVFILLGLLIAQTKIFSKEILIASLLAVIVVAVMRAFSVYLSLAPLKLQNKEKPVPLAWQHLLSWGSLRGALAITMVLLIPNDLTVDAWRLSNSPKEFIMALTVTSIYFTLFVKGLSISALIKKLKISEVRASEQLEYLESKALAYGALSDALENRYTQGEISEEYYQKMKSWLEKKCEHSDKQISKYVRKHKSELEENLHLYAINIEKEVLETLYEKKEITENAYKKFMSKLDEKENELNTSHASKSFDEIQSKAFVEYLSKFLNKFFKFKNITLFSDKDKYSYYKALIETARQVAYELEKLRQEKHLLQDNEVLLQLIDKYNTYKRSAEDKLKQLLASSKLNKHEYNLSTEKLLREEKQSLDALSKKHLFTKRIEDIVQQEIEEELRLISNR